MPINEYHLRSVHILRELSSMGVKLDVRDGKVSYQIPPSLPIDEVLEKTRFAREHLIELLS